MPSLRMLRHVCHLPDYTRKSPRKQLTVMPFPSRSALRTTVVAAALLLAGCQGDDVGYGSAGAKANQPIAPATQAGCCSSQYWTALASKKAEGIGDGLPARVAGACVVSAPGRRVRRAGRGDIMPRLCANPGAPHLHSEPDIAWISGRIWPTSVAKRGPPRG